MKFNVLFDISIKMWYNLFICLEKVIFFMKYIYNKDVLNTLFLMRLLLQVLRNLVVFEIYYLGIYWISADGSFDFKSMASTYMGFVFIFMLSNIIKRALDKDLVGIFRNLLNLIFVGLIFEKSNHMLTSINNNQAVLIYFFEVLVVISIVSLVFTFIFNKMFNNVLFNYYVDNSDEFRLIQRKLTYDSNGNEVSDYTYYHMKGFNPFGIGYVE